MEDNIKELLIIKKQFNKHQLKQQEAEQKRITSKLYQKVKEKLKIMIENKGKEKND